MLSPLGLIFTAINTLTVEKYTVICGTNRPGNLTQSIAEYYCKWLNDKSLDVSLLLLEGLDLNQRTPHLEHIEQNLLIPAAKFVFVIPEYNGSFPGAVKSFIDLCQIPACFYHKKALLTGIADGRAGNLRGMEHLTGILNHMQVVVHPNKLPISVVRKLLNPAQEIQDAKTLAAISRQLTEFAQF